MCVIGFVGWVENVKKPKRKTVTVQVQSQRPVSALPRRQPAAGPEAVPAGVGVQRARPQSGRPPRRLHRSAGREANRCFEKKRTKKNG